MRGLRLAAFFQKEWAFMELIAHFGPLADVSADWLIVGVNVCPADLLDCASLETILRPGSNSSHIEASELQKQYR